MVESAQPRDHVLYAAVLTAQGITAKELGDLETAARCYAEVSRIHGEAGATPADAATLAHNLAGLHYAHGHHSQAEAQAQRAAALRSQVPRVLELDLADLAVLASTLAARQRYDEARSLLVRTVSAYRAARPPRPVRYLVDDQRRHPGERDLSNLIDTCRSA